jgi:GNAT superfamily N-acetyltransferase
MATIRPMTEDDLDGVAEQLFATLADAAARGSWSPFEVNDEVRERTAARLRYQLSTDPGGCWVADAGGGTIAGHTIALRRGHLWGLAMLHVLPSVQSKGTGRRLLAAALGYGRDAEAGIITSSEDPRAMRLYAMAGFSLRPAVEASGAVHRPSLRDAPDVRSGSEDDLALTVEVDEVIRGVPHGEGGRDIAEMMRTGGALLGVMSTDVGQGYVVTRDGHIALLAATTPAAAQQLLWYGLTLAAEHDDASIYGLTGAQQWAIEVAYAAGLTVKPGGPVLTKGRVGPLTPYIPSGQYL